MSNAGGWFLVIAFLFFAYGLITGNVAEDDKSNKTQTDWNKNPMNKKSQNYVHRHKG